MGHGQSDERYGFQVGWDRLSVAHLLVGTSCWPVGLCGLELATGTQKDAGSPAEMV